MSSNNNNAILRPSSETNLILKKKKVWGENLPSKEVHCAFNPGRTGPKASLCWLSAAPCRCSHICPLKCEGTESLLSSPEYQICVRGHCVHNFISLYLRYFIWDLGKFDTEFTSEEAGNMIVLRVQSWESDN